MITMAHHWIIDHRSSLIIMVYQIVMLKVTIIQMKFVIVSVIPRSCWMLLVAIFLGWLTTNITTYVSLLKMT